MTLEEGAHGSQTLIFNVKRRSKGRPYYFRQQSVGIEARNGGAGSRVSLKKLFHRAEQCFAGKPVRKLRLAMMDYPLNKSPPDATEYAAAIPSCALPVFSAYFEGKR